jgi:dihydroorotate dehydrogenase
VTCFKRLAASADYCTANISSPNTPGLRGLQNRSELEALLIRLTEARNQLGLRKPILLKIAPDLDDAALDDIAAVCLASGIEGIIVSNTTLARDGLLSAHRNEAGGLSGAPLFALSTSVLRKMRARIGTKLLLVGAGGVTSGADAYAKIRAGASLVQLYSALVYRGPALAGRIKSELSSLLARDGFARVADAVGKDN